MRRLTEIQFYFFCRKIIYYSGATTKAIISLIDLLTFTNYYDKDILIDIVTQMFVKQKGAPTLIECVVLAAKGKDIKYKDIRNLFKVSQRDIERTFDKACELDLMYKTPDPKFSKEAYENIKGFQKAIDKIIKWNGNIEDGQREKEKTNSTVQSISPRIF